MMEGPGLWAREKFVDLKLLYVSFRAFVMRCVRIAEYRVQNTMAQRLRQADERVEPES